MIFNLIFFLLFFLPLVVVPFGPSYFEPPKVLIAEITVEALLYLTFFYRKRESLKEYSPLLMTLLGGVFLLSIFDLVFLRTQTTFFGNPFRLQGIFLLWHLLALAFLASRIELKKVKFLAYLIPAAVLLGSSFLLGKNEAGRVVGTLGEPNALGAAAIFLWPYLFFYSPSNLTKALSLIFGLVMSVIPESRSAVIAFTVQVIFVSATKLNVRLGKAALLSGLILLSSYILPFIQGGGVYENRAEVWAAALAAGQEQPILGGGFGNLEQLIPRGSEVLKNNARFQYVDSAHNLFLDWWIAGGILGLAILITFLSEVGKNFITRGWKLELTILLGLLTVMSFNPVSVVTLIQFWWLIGQGFREGDV